MNQRAASEVCFGLVLKGADKGMFNAEHFVDPYNTALQDVGDMELVELKATHGYDAIRAAEYAAEEVPISEAAPYIRLLETAAVRADVGKQLSRISKKLLNGENGEADTLLLLASKLDKGETGFTNMADVQILAENEIWVPCGYEPIDANAGGLPFGGLTIIAGPAKLGKSTLLLRLLAEFARAGRHTAFFSLEMSKELAKMRLLQIDKLTKKQLEFIHVMDDPMREEKVYSESMRLAAEYKIEMIGVDYASKMLQGREASVSTMSSIYAAMGDLSKNAKIPVLLLSGVSRGYIGGEPEANHIWFSGLAEHEASLIIIIHNPALLDVDMSSKNQKGLPYVPGHGYIKFSASRLGMKRGSLGAACVAWDDKKGAWGSKTSEWYPHYAG